jgi:hypothetical protein
MNKGETKRFDKLVISGPRVERLVAVYYPPQGRRRAPSEEEKRKRKEKKQRILDGIDILNEDDIEPSIQRSRSKLRRLIEANAWQWTDKRGNRIPPKLLTLTFRENITNLTIANRRLSKFVQNTNYMLRNILKEPLKYVCVVEFQQRGAIHYHMVIFNLPFIDYVFSKFRTQWKDRFQLETISDNGTGLVIYYISKYLKKQNTDIRFYGKKRYSSSTGLIQPIIVRDDIANEMICNILRGFRNDTRIIDIPCLGRTTYTSYFLGHANRLKTHLLDPYCQEAIKSAQLDKKKK